MSDLFNSLSAQITNFFQKEDAASSLGQVAVQFFHRISSNEEARLDFLTQLMVASSAIMFVSLTFLGFRASYGRYAPDSLLAKFSVPARLAWFIQEMPSLLLPLFAIWQTGWANIPAPSKLALAMFTGHYFQRTMIYPFLIRHGKPTPIHLLLLGICFCTWNGYIQGFYHAKYAHYADDHFWTFGSLFGIPLFFFGALINLHSDHILRSLRRPGESGYKIPHGGAFQYVSGANFFGEILEWIGYALFAQTRTAWAFAIVTAANTIPRARQHHRWYLQRFKEQYPADRTAVIPFIY